MWRFPPSALLLLSMTLALSGAWTNARLALACAWARHGDGAWLDAAVRLAPGDASLRLRRAQPGGATAELDFHEAIRAAPRLGEARLAYAAWLEAAGRASDAERNYLLATRFDRGFRPRFALANFHYRAANRAESFIWCARAAAVPKARLDGIFALLPRVAPEGANALQQILPAEPGAWRQCLDFYLPRQQWRTVRWAAHQLSEMAQQQDTARLLWYADFELLFGEPRMSLEIWNLLVRAGWTAGPALYPESGPWLANPTFELTPAHRAFDWRIREGEGYRVTISGRPRYLTLELSGTQSDGVDFAQQFVLLSPGDRYRFAFEARTDGLRPDAGLAWVALDGRSGAPLADVRIASAEWTGHRLDFRCPPARPLVRLALRYERPARTPRAEGRAAFRGLSLDRIPETAP